MQLVFPNILGSAELQLQVLNCICGSDRGSMIDFGSGNCPVTRLLGFKDKKYIDIVERDLGEQENKYFHQHNILEFINSPLPEKADVIFSLDNIEHFWEEDGKRIIKWMEENSRTPIVFTPNGDYMNVHDKDNSDPDTHKHSWTDTDFENEGWSTITFPNFHPSLGKGGLGAFFAFKCENLEQEFNRISEELTNKIQMQKIEQIKLAIDNADKHKSNLPPQILDLQSFNSHKIKHLLNNLGAISTRYLECGIHKAGGFVCAMYGNENLLGVGLDNWSQFEQNGLSKKMAYDYCKTYFPETRYSLREGDCFEIIELPIQKFDMYTYDANHGFEEQYKGIVHFLPFMADEFILCVDDTDWEAPRLATKKAIEDFGLTVLFETHLSSGKESDGENWWNGFDVFLLKK